MLETLGDAEPEQANAGRAANGKRDDPQPGGAAVKRRRFLLTCAAAGALPLARASADPDPWLKAIADKTGDTVALERLGIWLQAPVYPATVVSTALRETLTDLRRLQGSDGYLGVYPEADRLGGSERAVDEYWGLAELGRGLARWTVAGEKTSREIALGLLHRVCSVDPDRLDRVPEQQHPAAAALLHFLCRVTARSGDDAGERYLRRLPARIGLPGETSETPPALPPLLRSWTGGGRADSRGTAALSGILSLARYQTHPLLSQAVRARWGDLLPALPRNANPELLARWARLTADLHRMGFDEAQQVPIARERRRLAGLTPPDELPYTDLLYSVAPF